ncbi:MULTISPECIES: preprotein translocase subunit SecE [Roseiflexus]|jgi:preprotein translocase subunit SecE|uniref:Protein translocase subunit SecE n=1 Tax=Roseiflexus castenholzii (strain DSM 13941 / HLO8) TaxID=383372 RepID=A7NS00_ROSCS|nr:MULTISPECIES: preprotein translocase subunit SecE [Roseiflexus]ABU60346.1 preprotein translocase, SecE subunit [Roseiflexus castenholzii DSM 13941]PMP78201.1 MAG: preprotein translocase subunit SecE [Roseiflexus castenholzii]GIV98725.1 MAG: protein translocase subunit SecE [Roseiflexus sp.]
MTVVKDKDKESQNALARAFQNAIVQPLRESRAEMRKVVWPTREETIRLTVVVILLSAVMSAILFAADALFSWLLLLLQNAVATL